MEKKVTRRKTTKNVLKRVLQLILLDFFRTDGEQCIEKLVITKDEVVVYYTESHTVISKEVDKYVESYFRK